jgi:hypothetical protein
MFTIYRYIAPDGRSYIGKTGLQQGARAQHNGVGYRTSSRFWNAIQEYGWESFTYQVLAVVSKSLPDAERRACLLESKFIKEYRTVSPRFGFNMRPKDGPKNYEKLSETRKNMRPMSKDGITRQIPETDYARYLADGWKPGYNRTS